MCLLSDEARSACQATVAQCRELSAKLQQLSSLEPLLEAAEAQVHGDALDLPCPTHIALLIIPANRCWPLIWRGSGRWLHGKQPAWWRRLGPQLLSNTLAQKAEPCAFSEDSDSSDAAGGQETAATTQRLAC